MEKDKRDHYLLVLLSTIDTVARILIGGGILYVLWELLCELSIYN